MRVTNMTIEEMCTTTEKQQFDRKSAKIEATAIATPIIASLLLWLKRKP